MVNNPRTVNLSNPHASQRRAASLTNHTQVSSWIWMLIIVLQQRQPSVQVSALRPAITMMPFVGGTPYPSVMERYPRPRSLRASFRSTRNNVNGGDDTSPKKPDSYVPSGLTRDQYEKIKADELQRKEKMDFGAWGPRFNRSESPPPGDWFTMPQLWTNGSSVRGSELGNSEHSDVNRNFPFLCRSLSKIRALLPALILCSLAVEYVLSAVAFSRVIPNNPYAKAVRVVLSGWRKKVALTKSLWLSSAAKLCVAAVLASPVSAFLKSMGNSCSKSQSWTWIVTAGAMTLSLAMSTFCMAAYYSAVVFSGR